MKLAVELEQNQWNVVIAALGRGPYVEVAQIIQAIAQQCNEQTKPKPELQVVKSD